MLAHLFRVLVEPALHGFENMLMRVATEMALHVLAYNLTRVINILGPRPLACSDQDIATAVRMSPLTRFHRSKGRQRAPAPFEPP